MALSIARVRVALMRRFGRLAPPRDIADIRPEHFRAAGNVPFLVHFGDGGLSCRLAEVKVQKWRRADGSRQFSVLLHGTEPAPALGQVCRVDHAWMGSHALFVSRIQPPRPDDPPTFEICFS